MLRAEIEQRLQSLTPEHIEIQDDSDLHRGHAGNTGGGHFTITVKSSLFSGKSQIMRHRMVYQCLQDLMPHRIHALSITALSTDESFI
ncbi:MULTISPECIES: BolA family protein [unclassified Methylophilus]|jgi:BolA family transcriptional regulator, general stress-responsive regulator|uniref:BolA family protein n=1 Tax=Methylophilus glucosoxydans TaxID=752553 RepID=A0ABW3GGQ0_9PROT|nr:MULTISPECIES: BolA family protein [unclassified Methylophilus]MBF5039238.1 BolA family transcriptional regulator [Methylophilus sp. 13]MDF0377403.1 BolA/IbaG family iron-sulfur metabolism protein [Methylophilus sp. YYY-1]MDT7849475.1 BolA family protein [Methylophilus sp. VKM B-3414]